MGIHWLSQGFISLNMKMKILAIYGILTIYIPYLWEKLVRRITEGKVIPPR